MIYQVHLRQVTFVAIAGVATMNAQRQVLLITTVEIGNGRTENINVRCAPTLTGLRDTFCGGCSAVTASNLLVAKAAQSVLLSLYTCTCDIQRQALAACSISTAEVALSICWSYDQC